VRVPVRRSSATILAGATLMMVLPQMLPARRCSLAPALAIGGWMDVLLISVFGAKNPWMSLLPLPIAATALLLDKDKRSFKVQTGYRLCVFCLPFSRLGFWRAGGVRCLLLLADLWLKFPLIKRTSSFYSLERPGVWSGATWLLSHHT
jgi:hypothetical protein